MRYQSVDCALRVRLSSGGPGRDPNPEFPPRNPISERLRVPVPRSGYRKKGWRVAQPKDPPALVWVISLWPRWLSPRHTSRLGQPGHPGRRTDPRSPDDQRDSGLLESSKQRCPLVDDAQDWAPQLVSLA